jgi:hypothetical protein
MVMILQIIFGIWLFFVVMIVAFIRGSNLKTPPSQRTGSVSRGFGDGEVVLDTWRRAPRDAG